LVARWRCGRSDGRRIRTRWRARSADRRSSRCRC
jgi:hypothetical protein